MPETNEPIENIPVVFLAFANARMNNRPFLRNLPEEQRGIRNKLEILKKAGLCEIVERANATLEEIMEVFQDQAYKDRIAIFHYGGHADHDLIFLESDTGKSSPVHNDGFVDFLSSQQSLRLVFLNGCLTKKIALALNHAGIPSVIGTYKEINDDVATRFAICFYQGIANGLPLEMAWRDAENYIKMRKGTKTFTKLYQKGVTAEDHFPWDSFDSKAALATKQWTLVKKEKISRFIKEKIKTMIVGAVVSYVISLIIDLILGISWREIKLDNKELYIDRPGVGWDLWIHYFILAAIWILVCYLFVYRTRKFIHIPNNKVFYFFGVLFLAASLSIFFIQIIPIPTVSHISEITGGIEHLNSYPYLFVRPVGSSQCWLQEPIPLQPDQSGLWRGGAYFSGISGSKFELIIVVSKNKLANFSLPGDYLCNEIPRHIKRFVRIVKLE